MKSLLPLEIVGGGLAGLALGLALRRAGVPVTVFEAGVYPRHRVCGEFISGLDSETIARLQLQAFLDDALPHRSVTYYVRQKPLPSLALPTVALGLSRPALDTSLAEAFVAAGGHLQTNARVAEDETPPGRIFAAGRSRHGQFWVGLKIHARRLALVDDLEIHLGDQAYIGLSRIEGGAVNACGIFAHRVLEARGADLLPAYLEAAGMANVARRLRDADLDPDSFCVTASSRGDRQVAAPDRIRIGDACATSPAFTGNGLAMALQGAALALDPLLTYAAGEASWDETIRTIGRGQQRRFSRRLKVAHLVQPFILDSRRQTWLAALVRCHLLPFRAFYAAMH